MMERLALWQGVFYEGNSYSVRSIHPLPIISPITCEFIPIIGTKQVIFREDNFDPVTRIRRGRLYVCGKDTHKWDQVKVDNGHQYNWGNLKPEASYEPWKPDVNPESVIGHTVQVGADGFETIWRIVGVEKISIGQVLLTLRAKSLFGVIPEMADSITDMDGTTIDNKPVQESLDALVDTFHRQQATPTVNAARETARVILRWWCGDRVEKMDLGDAIKEIPNNMCIAQWAGNILARLHPRVKSCEKERQAAKGSPLRPVVEEDAECAVNLVGLLLREIGWAVP